MDQDDIEDMLHRLRKIKNSGVDLNSVKIDEVETLEVQLRFFRTFSKYHHACLPDSLVKITQKAEFILEMIQSVFGGIPDECKSNLNVESLVSQFQELIEGNTSLTCNFKVDDSYLSEYMDYLDKNLSDVLMYLDLDGSDITNEEVLQYSRLEKQVKIIQKKMRFLKYLYFMEINGYTDHEKQEDLETRIQFMADNVGQFCFSLWVLEDEADENGILSKPPYLLSLIVIVELEMKKIFLKELKFSKFIQSKTFKKQKLPKDFPVHLQYLLMYLRNKMLDNFLNNVSAQSIDAATELMLSFLADVSNPVFDGEMLNEALEKVGALVGDILCAIHRSTIEDDTCKIDFFSTQILAETENLKAQLERYYKSLKFIPSQFPTVGGLSFLGSLLRKLNELLISKSGLDFMMKPHIRILEKELLSLTSIFGVLQHEHEILKDLQRRTINWAYEAEVAIDSILAQYNALWHCFCSLPAITNEIKHISAEVTEIWSENLALKLCSAAEPSKHLPIPYCDLTNDEEIVGFHNDMKIIVDLLIRETNELDVIPIVGMGGQGKTTCARKLYNNGIIASYFGVRTWCIISQTYNRRELLQEIFSQVTNTKDKGDKADVLADMLKKSLMGKRYLIVLDDMWDGMAWDDLNLCFPDDGNKSRIIVTTRLEKVGEHVKQYTDPYFLPFLTPKESCQLLQKKVFQQEDFPPELQDVSLAVAEKCKGLPLVVVLAAGIIKKKRMEETWWHEVKDALFSYLDRETKDYGRMTMHLSYDNLPDYLKPCLLYMGMFPEDHKVPVSKLISLWIAEGLVQNNIESARSMEEAAEDYLMDLISSNVVMVSSRRYNGKVKYCQVHDVILHFCLEMSKQEKFMLAVRGDHNHSQPFDWKENRLSLDVSDELKLKSKFGLLGCETRRPFHLPLRSLITTNRTEFLDWNPFVHVGKFRLLRVLDLNSHRLIAVPPATLHPLFHLKYLAVSTYEFNFHPELHMLHLETLIVKFIFGSTVLPVIFWRMKKLRHVEITRANFDLENNKQQILEEYSKLENLRVLRRVEFPIGDADSIDVLLRRCPNLEKLEINLSGYDYSAEICLKLDSLTQLQSLRLSFPSSQLVSKLYLPSSLKKLVLSVIHLQSTVPMIAGLPRLEYLLLSNTNYVQPEEWCLGDITFDKLKILKLVNLDISRWDASDESFPQLEMLVIDWCNELKEIPITFADIQTLKQIQLVVANESLKVSAVKIKEEIKENGGNDRLNLIIKDFKR